MELKVIEEKCIKELKKLEDELFARIDLPHVKIGITKSKFTMESARRPIPENTKVVIPFKNDKELNFLDLTHASGTKIS